jgi:hypothetical protein
MDYPANLLKAQGLPVLTVTATVVNSRNKLAHTFQLILILLH